MLVENTEVPVAGEETVMGTLDLESLKKTWIKIYNIVILK